MQIFKIAILATSVVALAGCAVWDNSPICRDNWYEYKPGIGVPCDVVPASKDPMALEKERQRLADELAAAQKQNGTLSSRVGDLERQLADRDRELASLRAGAVESARLASQLTAAQARAADKDKLAAELAAARQRQADLEAQRAEREKELAGLRSDLSAEMAKLEEAQRGLIRALRPEIGKGDIAISLNEERLLINLASGYLFGSGEDNLKPAGADALKRVGEILKDYPEYKVAVEGHTDNVPIVGALKEKFPTNMELSEARAANAATALGEGGLSASTTHGYADTKPVKPNTTADGRAKNRRVEVRVTK